MLFINCIHIYTVIQNKVQQANRNSLFFTRRGKKNYLTFNRGACRKNNFLPGENEEKMVSDQS